MVGPFPFHTRYTYARARVRPAGSLCMTSRIANLIGQQNKKTMQKGFPLDNYLNAQCLRESTNSENVFTERRTVSAELRVRKEQGVTFKTNLKIIMI